MRTQPFMSPAQYAANATSFYTDHAVLHCFFLYYHSSYTSTTQPNKKKITSSKRCKQ